jgi:hypothetical protein
LGAVSPDNPLTPLNQDLAATKIFKDSGALGEMIRVIGVVLGLTVACSYDGVTKNQYESNPVQAIPTSAPSVSNNQVNS